MRALALLVLASLAPLAAPAAGRTYDLLIRNGRVVDGTGAPWRRADVAVRGDTIVAVVPGSMAAARRVIDVAGRVVAPGFIDLHTHARRGIFEVPTAENYVRQGVTTLVEGPDGSSALPLGPFLDKVEALGPGVNFASLVGHGSMREAVLGRADRAPAAAELARMQDLVREAMREGAFGLSTGLFYVPGSFARTDEVVALARVAGELGGIHVSHMRDEAAGVLDSVQRDDRDRRGRAAADAGHAPQDDRPRGLGPQRRVPAARRGGAAPRRRRHDRPVSVHGVEHRAAAALFPPWALEGGAEALRRAARGSRRPRAHARGRDGQDPQRARRRRPPQHRDRGLRLRPVARGKTLAAILADRGLPPTVENAAELALEIVERGGASGIFHAISEEDVERILVSPYTMVASDGEIPAFGQGAPHPRSYGTFARVLGRLRAREEAAGARGGGAQDDVPAGGPAGARATAASCGPG